ncbi:MAG: hypothetical protein JWR16_1210 [Nevskia sp.]|nr:hypothetical protein [Nevskia sp.]
MIDAIGAVGAMLDATSTVSNLQGVAHSNFSDRLDKAIEDVNADVVNADKQVQALILGQNTSLHGVMIALSNAHVSLDLMIQVRNRLVDAYQDVMRMQI